jgi:hypothetical protein
VSRFFYFFGGGGSLEMGMSTLVRTKVGLDYNEEVHYCSQ